MKRRLLYISVPVTGRKMSDIKMSIMKLQNTAESIIGEILEPIYQYTEGDEEMTGRDEMKRIGEYISAMKKADFFIGITEYWSYRDARIERNIAEMYAIPSLTAPMKYICPDMKHNCADITTNIPWEDDGR